MEFRLIVLAKKSAEEGIILTETQAQALERKQADVEACGEIEIALSGYLGSQDTFYVGTIKGVGLIYQQTYGDTIQNGLPQKLYTAKTPITAADLLKDHVLPLYTERDMVVVMILTGRGTE